MDAILYLDQVQLTWTARPSGPPTAVAHSSAHSSVASAWRPPGSIGPNYCIVRTQLISAHVLPRILYTSTTVVVVIS